MEAIKLCLLLTTHCILLYQAEARPEGPPDEACLGMQPAHPGNPLPQSTQTFVQLEGLETMYAPGNTLEFNISSSDELFRGFMIQARAIGDEPFGIFIAQDDGKQQTMQCSSADDTLSHMNRDTVTSVNVQWRADNIDTQVTSFNFYYTIVQNVTTFWVRIQSAQIQVLHPTTPPPPVAEGEINHQLVKAHGSLMLIAWGILAPIGILMAIFYKVVWPTGEWFYSHIGIMIGTLVLTIAGLIVIIVHAEGQWLATTPVNLPHQILGILVSVAVAANPLMAIFRCDPSNKWRFVFNLLHGTVGLVFGEGLALAAMLLGLNIFKDLPGVYRERVHIAIYIMSGIVGIIIMIFIWYNFYEIMFRKYLSLEADDPPATSDLSSPGMLPDQTIAMQKYEQADDEVEPSRDYLVRAAAGIMIIVVMVLLAIAAVVFIALA